jgi:class 3 adenylate cyclase
MDVGKWLRSLGLGEYETSFKENRIDAEVLTKLTSEDLKELGVVAVGDRRKLLTAIEDLSCPLAAQSKSPTPEESTATDFVARRQLTVMFADLVGSTALSARLDPEEMRAVIGACRKACASVIEREDGFVAKYMGDAVLAYFGYPRAHEDDAERAVRAGLSIVEAVCELTAPDGSALGVRVGISTGIVVVGDLLGSGESHERGVVGDTPNLAARLQGIAKPGGVVIAEATRRMIGDLFELQDLGAQTLKGVSAPTQAYAVLRVLRVESRFEALHPEGLTLLVGREEELELLTRRWAKAKAGEGQVALISGEPGIGKSRLTMALKEHIQYEPHARLRYFCSPQHVDSAFYPIIGELERAAGIAREDDLKTTLDKLDAELERRATPSKEGELFSNMLSLGGDGRYPELSLTPQQRRRKTLDALVAQIEGLSSKIPTLLIFEDAQWADPSSLETLDRLVDRIEGLNALLIVTYRPEFAPPWIGRPHVTALTLNRLTRLEIAEMVENVAMDKPLPEGVKFDIVERAGGVPLFAEEITKAMLETADEGTAPACAFAANGSPALPASLHASLLARLDRLGAARDIVQMAAAIGQEFSHALLAHVTQKNEAELDPALDRLVRAGLLLRHGVAPDATYVFKHALCQDVAYSTLLREPRRALHARIAEAMEYHLPDLASTQPEVLARHYAEAGFTEKAAAFWAKAGRHSLARSALAEAEPQLERAIALIADLPSSPAASKLQEELRADLAKAKAQRDAVSLSSRPPTKHFVVSGD